MKPYITMVTLGVTDLERSRKFYCEGLGWTASSASQEAVVFIQAGRVVLGLFSRESLAEDADVSAEGSGFRGITLAHNVGSREEVDAVFDDVRRARATIVKEPQEVFWGGYSGYFADPDGHLWEVAHNPFWPLGDDGSVTLP
ncbi:MAG: VOC family protein [Deltaproteobacteria bacterium]|nr:VOC family protein [Deltaproteobacteria bacterium]